MSKFLTQKEDTNSKTNNWIVNFNLKLSLIFVIIAAFTIVLFTLPVFYSEQEISMFGQLGDLFGGIMNPLIAISAALLTFLAFWMQYQANQDIQQQFKVQQFERQFYEMLRLYKENVNEMKIQGYVTEVSSEAILPDNEKTIHKIIERNVEGRKVFVSMYEELNLCIKICKSLNSKLGKMSLDDLNKIAFDIFFFGIKSNYFLRNFEYSSKEEEELQAEKINLLRRVFKDLRNKHKKNGASDVHYEIKGCEKRFKINLKYRPFSGHENRLGHYYRHLFYTVKYVVGKEKEGVITYNEAREYLKLLRAQMSNYEQLLLYYNYIIGYGRDWENEGFLTKYRMLHNLPIDKVKNVYRPRRHFKEFIATIQEGETPMFERGDKKSNFENFI